MHPLGVVRQVNSNTALGISLWLARARARLRDEFRRAISNRLEKMSREIERALRAYQERASEREMNAHEPPRLASRSGRLRNSFRGNSRPHFSTQDSRCERAIGVPSRHNHVQSIKPAACWLAGRLSCAHSIARPLAHSAQANETLTERSDRALSNLRGAIS